MRIGWITPTVGIFGAVREMLEVSNVLVEMGHQVLIFHPDGGEISWLPSRATCRPLDSLKSHQLEALIGIVDWDPSLYVHVKEAEAALKALCLLGFNPTQEMAQALRREIPPRDEAETILLDAMDRGYHIFSDSLWQADWFISQVGYPAGPSFGGINTKMFHPLEPNSEKLPVRIVYSNDPRERKGTDTVEKAIADLRKWYNGTVEFDSYWGRRFDQRQLVTFLQNSDIFLDGHRRAGWCNPVIEAMACGSVPVCTSIGATREFAVHNETAMVIAPDDHATMVEFAMQLIDSRELRLEMRSRGIEKVKEFSYAKVGREFGKFLQERIL